jgi:hypothetical protein
VSGKPCRQQCCCCCCCEQSLQRGSCCWSIYLTIADC